MKITIITLFPDMLRTFFSESIIKRAQEKGQVEINIVNLRDFSTDKYKTVDDRPYGGGAGMVIKVDVVSRALASIPKAKVILTSARGEVYTQEKAQAYSQLEHLVILAGHYEGFDERISELVDEEVSIGDFILTGGEIPAAAIVDSVVRLLPGVLKKDDATQQESFFTAHVDTLIDMFGEDEYLQELKHHGVTTVRLLEYPQYTRPESFEGKNVPEILLSGDHKKIEDWQLKEAYRITKKRRPDLLRISNRS